MTEWQPGPEAVIRDLTEANFYEALTPDIDAASDTVLILAPSSGTDSVKWCPAWLLRAAEEWR